jgi:Secretion system C-terminal sorting domain
MKLINSTRIQKQLIALSLVLAFIGLEPAIAQQQLSAYNNSNVTPALMLSFSGSIGDNSSSQLTWTMENETSGKMFIIERSANGNEFDSLGQIVARNNAHDTSYSYIDTRIMMGHNYYRIRMVDNNGVERYSKIICLDNNKTNSTAGKIQLYPNPALSVVNFALTSSKNEEVTIQIFNLAGILLTAHQQQISAGMNQQSICVNGLKTGNYILKITGNQGSTEFVQMFSKI